MFKNLFKIFKEPEAIVEPIVEPEVDIEYYTELYTQSLANVRYLRATINTMGSMANYAKGESAGETRKKRLMIRENIEWYTRNLEEEEAMVTHYGRLAKIIN